MPTKRKWKWTQPEVTICFLYQIDNDLKRILIAKEGQGVGKPVLSSVAGGSVNWHEPSGRQFGNMYQKPHPFNIVFLLLGIYLKRLIWQVVVCIRMFNSVLFIKAQGWEKLICPSVKGWLNQSWENWWCTAILINFWILSYSNSLLDGKIKQNKAGCKTVHLVQPYIWETQCLYICQEKSLGCGVDRDVIISDIVSLYFSACLLACLLACFMPYSYALVFYKYLKHIL